jgi:uncharacterized membrane protein
MAILKLIHVLFIFVWIGTLLTIGRLMGYLAKEPPLVQERVARLARRMYLFIDFPSMIIAVTLGITSLLINEETNWKAPWLHMKLTFAFFIIVCDLFTGAAIIRRKIGTGNYYKILHGVTGLFFIGVLIAIYILKKCFCE